MRRSPTPLVVLVLVCTVARAGEPAEAAADQARAQATARFGHFDLFRRSLLHADAELNAHIRDVGLVDALLAVLTEDAVVNIPGFDVAQGRDAAAATLRQAIPTPDAARFDRTTYSGDVSHDGLVGYTFGRGTAALRQPDGSTLARNTLYIVFWRRHGWQWRVEATMWNTSSAAPTEPPAGFPLTTTGDRGTTHWGHPRPNAASALAADTAFARLSETQGYTVAFAAYVAGDGVSLAGPVYWGADAVVGVAFAGWTPVETLAWTPLRAGSTFSGDLAWSVGDSHYTLLADDGSLAFESFGKYLTVWARQPDGSWRFLLDGGNARPRPAP